MALTGSLADFPLEGILRLLESTHKTGVLQIVGDGEVGTLEVMEGRLCAARYGEDTGREALGVIFAMVEASFSFHPGDVGPANLSGGLDALLERGVGEKERIRAIRQDIPNDRMRFTLSKRALEAGPITIEPAHWRLLFNIDGRKDVTALASLAGQSRLATLRQLHELMGAGLIDPLEPAGEMETPTLATPHVSAPRSAAKRWESEAFAAVPSPPAVEPAPRMPAVEPSPKAPAYTPKPQPPRVAPTPPPQVDLPPAASIPAPPVFAAQAQAPRASAPPVASEPAHPVRQAPAAAPAPPVARPQPPTEDLSALLEARLAALQQSTPATPDEFWARQAQQTPSPPSVEAPSAPEPTLDERMAALQETAMAEPAAPTQQSAPAQPAAPGQRSYTPPPPRLRSSVETSAPISHYLPPDTTAPILEGEVAPVKEDKKWGGGLFGFGRKKAEEASAEVSPVIMPDVPGTSAPGRLASFANALLAEYNSGQYGRSRLVERMNVWLRLVDEHADPLDRMLPVQDDRLDIAAIDRDFSLTAGPYLATLVRQIYEEAARVFGGDKAKKGYKSAIKNALGGDESLLRDRAFAPLLPRV